MNNHAAEQLKKRYGKEISQRKLLRQIRGGQFIKRLHSANPHNWIYDIEYDGLPIRLLVDEGLTAVITVLPPVFQGKKQKEASKDVRKRFPRVDAVEEAFDIEAERQEEERAIGTQLEELKNIESHWRKCLIEALQRIQELENQIDDLKQVQK
jgi:hypothetical protein